MSLQRTANSPVCPDAGHSPWRRDSANPYGPVFPQMSTGTVCVPDHQVEPRAGAPQHAFAAQASPVHPDADIVIADIVETDNHSCNVPGYRPLRPWRTLNGHDLMSIFPPPATDKLPIDNCNLVFRQQIHEYLMGTPEDLLRRDLRASPRAAGAHSELSANAASRYAALRGAERAAIPAPPPPPPAREWAGAGSPHAPAPGTHVCASASAPMPAPAPAPREPPEEPAHALNRDATDAAARTHVEHTRPASPVRHRDAAPKPRITLIQCNPQSAHPHNPPLTTVPLAAGRGAFTRETDAEVHARAVPSAAASTPEERAAERWYREQGERQQQAQADAPEVSHDSYIPRMRAPKKTCGREDCTIPYCRSIHHRKKPALARHGKDRVVDLTGAHDA